MKDLVASMHRAMQYCDTTLDVECRKLVLIFYLNLLSINHYIFRNMLSSAHVLAMDTKNLLDVVDSIRLRYPNVAYSSIVHDIFKTNSSPKSHAAELPQNIQQSNIIQEQQQKFQEQLEYYENCGVGKMGDGQLYSNEGQESMTGIYDNECIISQQHHNKIAQINQESKEQPLRIVEDASELYSNTSATLDNELAACTTVVQTFQTATSQKLMSN
jgi:focal adhesion kinase 1